MNPLLVCNIGWMARYQGNVGQPDKIVGGGKSVQLNHTGGEVCNFLKCDNGFVYGHVETIKGKVDRRIRIDEGLGADSDAESIDRIDVVWIATRPIQRGRFVVGWYKDATVFRDRQVFDRQRPSEQYNRDKITSYRIRAKAENAFLLPVEQRSLQLDPNKNRKGWIGEANWWFPEQRMSDPEIREFVRRARKLITEGSEQKIIRKTGAKMRWGGNADPVRKAQVEESAINLVTKHYEDAKHCIVKSCEKDNKGYDLEATPKNGGDVLCLEVKGLSGLDLNVGLTPNEFRALSDHKQGQKPHYRLCVVTSALVEPPTLRVFHYDATAGVWFDEIEGKTVILKIEPKEAAIISLA